MNDNMPGYGNGPHPWPWESRYYRCDRCGNTYQDDDDPCSNCGGEVYEVSWAQLKRERDDDSPDPEDFDEDDWREPR